MTPHWKSNESLTKIGFGIAWLGVVVTISSQIFVSIKWLSWVGICITVAGIILRQRAEQLRKIKVAPRKLSSIEKKTLLGKFSGVPKSPMRIHYIGHAEESKLYAIQFKELFTSAGFIIEQFSGAIAFEPCTGLGLTVCEWDSKNPMANGLKDAFISAGFEIQFKAIMKQKDSVVEFCIYPKPEQS